MAGQQGEAKKDDLWSIGGPNRAESSRRRGNQGVLYGSSLQLHGLFWLSSLGFRHNDGDGVGFDRHALFRLPRKSFLGHGKLVRAGFGVL